MNTAEYKLNNPPKDTISKISILDEMLIASSWDGVNFSLFRMFICITISRISCFQIFHLFYHS
jgi:hypothetical protein